MAQSPGWNDRVVSARHQASTAVGGEVVILGLERGIYYGLNETGARIWELLREPVRVADIHRAMLDAYEVPEDVAKRDLLELLKELLEAGLIEVRGEATP